MKKTILFVIVAITGNSCGPGKTPGQPDGEPIYTADSVASQINTPIPDSNKKEPDSVR